MNTYRIQYIRTYIANDNVQSTVILATNEQQARDIFADCEILSVTLDKRDYDQEMESQKNAARVWTSNIHVTDDDMDAVHNFIVAAEAGDRAAIAYGDFDLGTRSYISGGEVMELDGHLESRYDEQNGGDDLPF